MKGVFLIILIAISVSMLGQSAHGDTNSTGQRVGEWLHFLPNGSLDKVEYWVGGKKKIDVHEAFFLNAPEDSLVTYNEVLWYKRYEYADNGNLYRVWYQMSGGNGIYLYGKHQEVGLHSPLSFNYKGHSGTELEFEIKLSNRSGSTIQLYTKALSEEIGMNDSIVSILPGDTTNVQGKVKINPGESSYKGVIYQEDLEIEFILYSTGYDWSSTDFYEGKKYVVSRNFYFYRNRNEGVMQILDKNEQVIQAIPLGQEITNIDLSRLSSGPYRVKTIDYAHNKSYRFQIIIGEE